MTMPSRRSRRRAILSLALQLALAAALLLAWQGALLHPLEHLDERGHFVHLGGADGRDMRGENDRQDGPSDPSDKLGDALASLAACAVAAVGHAALSRCASESTAFSAAPGPRGSPPRFYRSQAPPVLL
jgi:hypothetical protein